MDWKSAMNKNFSLTSDRFHKLDSSKVRRACESSVSYEGDYKGKKRSGRGVFRWPNGACYRGEFVENKRHGEGIQEWPDGSSYVGQFQYDVREGYGRHTWFNGEIYEGTFFRDKRHGKGIYQWADGTRYVGHFYNDLKEGYGCFHFPDGKRFEGIYKNNERCGAGIMSYCDGRQDMGMWKGEKLIRLCTVMENTFVFQHFSDYFVNAGENMPSKIRRANSALADARTINENEERNQSSESVNDKENKSFLSLDQQIPETFPLGDILDGVRNSSLGAKGPCELASEEFLHIASEGDCIRVIELLEQGFVHVDVADKTGYTALLAASVNCHKDIVNCLLDYGADVNKLNYEGLSALAACHVLFYTKHTWKDNIGETLACENLFNSVHWNSLTGTFVQRKPVYCQSKTLCKTNLSENSSQSSVDTINGLSRDHLISDKLEKVDKNSKYNNRSAYSGLTDDIALENEENCNNMAETNRGIISKKRSEGLSIKSKDEDLIPYESQNIHLKFEELEWKPDKDDQNEIKQHKMNIGSANTKNEVNHEHIPCKKQDATSTVGGNTLIPKHSIEFKYDHGETASLERYKAHDEVKVSDANLGIKSPIVQRSEMVDKKTFIRVFLNRAASARSSQSSRTPFKSIDSSFEGSYLDNMDDVPDYLLQLDQNSDSLTTEEDKKGCKKREDDNPIATITAPDVRESVHYSIQNAISSSLQTTNTVDDTGSFDSTEQNKQKLLTQQRRPHLEATVQLLLRRGANPNGSCLPMPVLFFAVKAADTAAVKLLLNKGADTNARLSTEKLGITPLHIAVALPSDALSITKLLLEAGADPNLRDFAFGDIEDGRTPLHTACCREDNDEDANRVISSLLDCNANPNLLCNGHSALSLAIGSGNDLAVETLLKRNADPSLCLTHGVGSPLCAAVSYTAEKRRKIVDRIRLVNKLVKSGANILAPIIVSSEHPPGTVVDYAYNVFHQDRRIAHTPYHALTAYEREIYVARRKMLDHLAELLRTHVLKKEKKLLEDQLARAKALQSESSEEINQENLDRAVSFYFDERNETSVTELDSSFEKVSIYDDTMSCYSSSDSRFPDCGLRVAVIQTPSDHMNVSRLSINSTKKRQLIRKNRFRYCYECGRSVVVRLAACTRCKEVFYCSRNCKLMAWNSRHKDECIRISARNKSRRTGSSNSVDNRDKDSLSLSASKDSVIRRQNSRNSTDGSKKASC